MASTALQIFSFALLLSLFHDLSMASHLISKHNLNSPPSLFMKNLQGCRLGDKVQGLHKLKKYLQRFGYMGHAHTQFHATDVDVDVDVFDGVLESAIVTYQKNFNLAATGILDAETIAQMWRPRCGVADVFNGTTWMRSGKKRNRHDHSHGHFHTVSHYAFFEGNLKWPPSKSHLTYAFLPGYPSEAIPPVSRAFTMWASNTHFRFSHVSYHQKADIKISFEKGEHGDDTAFDGDGGTLAHAYPPTDGRLHFDADEPWSIGAVSGAYDVETVALHEIGHLLGLLHSSTEGAIMFPSISSGITKGLHGDDIAGIKALYAHENH